MKAELCDIVYVADDRVELRFESKDDRVKSGTIPCSVPLQAFADFDSFCRASQGQIGGIRPSQFHSWRARIMAAPRPISLGTGGGTMQGAMVPLASLGAFEEFLRKAGIAWSTIARRTETDPLLDREAVMVIFHDSAETAGHVKDMLSFAAPA